MIIAIDGPAGSGKSTTARLVAKKLRISYLDTGSMYRAVTLYLINNNYTLDTVNVMELMDDINLDISDSADEESIILNGVDVTPSLRSLEVSRLVSNISSNNLVRKKMVEIQRNISSNKSIVVDGRDIGTVVFPNADHKFFITASIEERAKRRFEQLNMENSHETIDSIMKEIESRDQLDSTREISPLKKASDAILIDTTDLEIDEQVNLILNKVNKRN